MSFNPICFCGYNRPFEDCCQPLINRSKQAQTPEQLMRSRFSAYATKAYQYIFDTYAKQSQTSLSIADIQASAEGCQWFALVIHPEEGSSRLITNSSEQSVEFSAFYIDDDKLIEMREKSRFVLEQGNCETTKAHKQWRYIDGDIIKHDNLADIKRNQLCPCNNYPTSWVSKKGKKYKQCCGK